MTVTTADAAIAAAVVGLGLTRVLSYQVSDALRDGRLVRVLADDEPPAVPASLIYPGQGRLPMKTRAFIDFAVGRMRTNLQALGFAPRNGERELEPPDAKLLPATPVQRRRRRLHR